MRKSKQPKMVIGWREWVQLPNLGSFLVKAKVDTGARSSSIHAVNLKYFESKKGKSMVRFQIHPMQRSAKTTIDAEAEIFEFRKVRSSNGHVTRRPVIVTDLQFGGQTWPIEITLANRDEMGFRMLLGRETMRHHCLIDPGASFVQGKPSKIG